MSRNFIASSVWCGFCAVVAAACSSAQPASDAASNDAAHTYEPGCSLELARSVCRDETGAVDDAWYPFCDDARAPLEIRPLDTIPLCYQTADGVEHLSCREPTTPGVFANDPEYLYCVHVP